MGFTDDSPWYISVPPQDPDDKGYCYNVDPATVGQYTGLVDKNDMKIFEGDIVDFEDAVADCEGYHDNVFINRAVFKYDEYSFVVCGDISTVTIDDLVYKRKFDGVVVGNVTDDLELLEGGDENG